MRIRKQVRMVMKEEFPEPEELRRQFLHILRVTPNKEAAASVLVDWVKQRIERPVRRFLGEMKQEVLNEIASAEKRGLESIDAFKTKTEERLDALQKEVQEDQEQADWWKKGDSIP